MLKYKEDESISFDEDIPNKLDKFYDNLNKVSNNRLETSGEKVKKLSKRNQYV